MKDVHFNKEELREKFFSCQGRLNRRPFIMRMFGVIIAFTVVALVLYSVCFGLLGSKTAADGVAMVISVIEVVSIYTLVVRRLHDLGYGNALAVVYLVIGILQPFLFKSVEGMPEDSMEVEVVQALNMFVMLLVVCLMLIRGKRGENQYGGDPLAR